MNLIEAKQIHKSFRGREVIKGIDMHIRRGEILAMIGPNGAGKSTTLSMLLGILHPDAGEIQRWRSDYKARIGVQLQSTPFFEGYTAEENLALFAAFYHVTLSKEQTIQKLIDCDLYDARKTPAVRLSGGQQKRLAIAITTVHNPELIVLDEPAAGLDPLARHDIRFMIRRLASQNVTVVFSLHDMEEVAKIADRVILIHQGGIVAEGKPDELLTQYQTNNLEDVYIQLTASENRRNKI